MSRTLRAYLLGISCWFLSFILALRLGVISNASWDLVAQLRLPRAILASAVGGGLAVAGAVLQALFSNPLCEPYTLGISSGAALGAIIGVAVGLPWFISGFAGSAFAGALLFTAVLIFISRRKEINNLTLLMAGVMLGFLGSSLVALWMAISDPNGIQGAILWLLGDLSRARLNGSIVTLVGVIAVSLALWTQWRALDGLLMGEEGAQTLGIAVARVRTRLIILVALLIALCVSSSGMIGFVGLVIPHFARKAVGSLHLRLIPLAAIWGAAMLTLADMTGRFAFRPFELPVGVITALLGAPLFLLIMLRRPRESV